MICKKKKNVGMIEKTGRVVRIGTMMKYREDHLIEEQLFKKYDILFRYSASFFRILQKDPNCWTSLFRKSNMTCRNNIFSWAARSAMSIVDSLLISSGIVLLVRKLFGFLSCTPSAFFFISSNNQTECFKITAISMQRVFRCVE